ncbi:MAG TPA: LuxR C-terminal-related transcriptional regulator [Chloroflexota bacterium]
MSGTGLSSLLDPRFALRNHIAERLKISRSTVDFYVSNVLGRFGATSRTEAVARAVSQHLAS